MSITTDDISIQQPQIHEESSRDDTHSRENMQQDSDSKSVSQPEVIDARIDTKVELSHSIESGQNQEDDKREEKIESRDVESSQAEKMPLQEQDIDSQENDSQKIESTIKTQDYREDESTNNAESRETQSMKLNAIEEEISNQDTSEFELHQSTHKDSQDIYNIFPIKTTHQDKSLNYLLYSKRLFIGVAIVACFIGLYTGYLFFGATSLEVLWTLQEERDAIAKEVENRRLENAQLQKKLLELQMLEPQEF